MQDRLDGGISLIIRCPGSKGTLTLSPEHLSLDLYITPRELHASPDRIGGDISVLVQAFAEEFAIPHLQRFTERCRIEGIVPPFHCKSAPSFSCTLKLIHFSMFLQDPASQVNLSAVPHLPAPTTATGSHIRCSARPSRQFQHDLQANAKSNTVTSSAVREGRAMALLDSNTPPNKIRQRRPADAFFTKGLTVPGHEIQGMREAASFTPLISLGLHTDAVLDRFKMDDAVLLKLRALVGSVRSSRWEVVLRSPKWDLTYEQASNLARALLMDVQGVHQKVCLVSLTTF